MKISYQWLKDFIDINQSPEELSVFLTDVGLEVESLEKVESINRMRFLEHGRSIKEVLTDSIMQGVDTLEDAKRVEEYLKKDTLCSRYKTMCR